MASGRPDLDAPVLTWIKSIPPASCYSAKEELKAKSQPDFTPNMTIGQYPRLRRYTVFWPTAGCERVACPLVIHLHGMSDTATTWGYPNLMTRANESTCPSRLGAILLAPDLGTVQDWLIGETSTGSSSIASSLILPFIEAFLAEHAGLIDEKRVYITGLSNGGELALDSALLRPDLFSLSVAIDTELSAGTQWAAKAVAAWKNLSAPVRLRDIVVSFGSKDDEGIVDFLNTMSDLEKKTGLASKVQVQIRVYQGIGHGTWDAVWMQWPDLFSVMFTQETPLGSDTPWEAWATQALVLLAIAISHATYSRYMSSLGSGGSGAAAGALDKAAASPASQVEAQPAAETQGAQPVASASAPSAPARSCHKPEVAWRADPEESHTLHGIFEEAAAKYPKQVCLKMVGHSGLTYEQVSHAVARCCAHVAALDEEIVGMVAHRSYEMIISLIAVLRAGKAYCPVEPDFPAARAELILQGASVQHALVPHGQRASVPALDSSPDVEVLLVRCSGEVLQLSGKPAKQDASRIPKTVPDDAAAYVLFTSGSTGKPKGVHVPHRGSAIYSKYVGSMVKLEGGRTHAFKVPYVFDPSVRDIFMCMLSGRALAIAPPGAHVDARELVDFIVQERVGYCNFAPTLLVEFITHLREHPSDLAAISPLFRFASCGGEALLETVACDLGKLLPKVTLLNVYGPTECSIDTSHFIATQPFEVHSTVVPIGWSTPHVVYKVFDPDRYEGASLEQRMLVPTPDGTPGELFIGGDCLALGYIGDPEKTAAVFFNFPELIPRPPHAASPFSMYKTGDLVRVREADGAHEFLGRTDFQVKVHGVRIECEEVAAVIKNHPKVNDIFVTKFDGPNDAALVAYVVPDKGCDWMPIATASPKDRQTPAVMDDFDVDTQRQCNDALIEWAGESHLLPVMRPAVYILMRALPLTTTGKVDRKALPSPEGRIEAVAGAEVVDSLGRVRRIRCEVEAFYQNLMQTVLCLNCIGILLCHWLPTDSAWVLPGASHSTHFAISFLQQASNFNFIALFLLLGYRTRRQSIADTREDMLALVLILLVMGWPYWVPQAAGIATFHRYTCLTLLASHGYLMLGRWFGVPAAAQVLALFGLAMAIGTAPVKTPGLPDGANSVWQYPALIALEPQFNGSWGLQFTTMMLFSLGFHLAPTAEEYARGFVAATSPLARALVRLLAGIAFVWLVTIPVTSSTESLASTRDNMYLSWDIMGSDAYKASVYPISLARWIATLFCMIVAFAQGNWVVRAVGRNFVGVYLVHMYASMDLLSIVHGLQPYGVMAELVAIVGVPVLYTLSVGAVAQELVSIAFRACLGVSRRWQSFGSEAK